MKSNKLTATVLAILSLCFPLCACNKKYTFICPIECEVGTPIVPFVYGDSLFISSCDSPFRDLKNHYVENYKGSKLFLFDTNFNYGHRPPRYDIKQEENGLFLREYFYCTDDELGIPSVQNGKTYKGSAYIGMSFTADIAIRPIEGEFVEKQFTFEFFREEDYEACGTPQTRILRFVNIYLNGECFATCYIGMYVPITQEWLENFLTEHLVWGDSLEYEEARG